MSNRVLITYETGGGEIPMAVLWSAGNRIAYRLCEDCPAIPYGSDELEMLIQQFIDLPVRISRLRHKTLPAMFDEIEPGSEEHFEMMLRDLGRFKTKPLANNNFAGTGPEPKLAN